MIIYVDSIKENLRNSMWMTKQHLLEAKAYLPHSSFLEIDRTVIFLMFCKLIWVEMVVVLL